MLRCQNGHLAARHRVAHDHRSLDLQRIQDLQNILGQPWLAVTGFRTAYSDDVNTGFRSDVNKDRSAATLALA
jgi:hypothetical protein